MGNTLKIELIVDDKGTVTMKNFGAAARKSFGEAEDAGNSLSRSMGGMESALKKVAAAVISYKAAEFAKDTALLAARYETLGVVMGVVGKNAGYSQERMDGFAAALQKSGISMTEARQGITRMAQAQLNLSQSTELARVAQDAAVIGQINSSDAFNRMIVGIQTGQVEILRTIGINVNFEESYRRVALATNRSAESFTEAEKAQIRMNAVMEAGGAIAGTYEAAMTTAGKKLTSFTRYVDDYKVKMGEAFGPATVILVDAATETMKRMQDEIQKPEAQKALKDLSTEIANLAVSIGTTLPGALVKTTNAMSGLTSVYNALPGEVVGAAGVGIVGRMLFGSWGPAKALAMIALVNAELEKMPGNPSLGGIAQSYKSGAGAMQNIIDVIMGRKDWNTGKDIYAFDVPSVAADTMKNLSVPSHGPTIANLAGVKEAKAIYDARQKTPEDYSKYFTEAKKLKQESNAASETAFYDQLNAQALALAESEERWAKERIDARALQQESTVASETAFYDQLNAQALALNEGADNEKKRREDRLQSERDMYVDMRGFEADYYTVTGLMIDEQAKKYKDLGITEVVIAKWAEGEKQKALSAYVDKAGTLYQRLTERTRKYKEDVGDIHKGLFSTLDAGFKDLEGQISDNFFDVLTGRFDEVRLDWDSMWSAMARSASDYVAKIAVTTAVEEGTKLALKGAGLIADLIDWSDWIGLAVGEWMVPKDKLALLHQGEMVVPENYAQMLRELIDSSGGYDGPAASFGAGLSSKSTTPNMDALNYGEITGHMGKGMGLSAATLGVSAIMGGPVSFAGLVSALGLAAARGIAIGAIHSIANTLGLTDLGYIAGIQDAYGISGITGLNEFGANVSAGMGGYGETSHGGHGNPSGDMGGPGGEPGDEGWRYGGISRGPDSGHLERLHGDEAVVPLPDGRRIPVEVRTPNRSDMQAAGAAGDMLNLRIEIPVVVDGREIGRVVAEQTEMHDEMVKAIKRLVN